MAAISLAAVACGGASITIVFDPSQPAIEAAISPAKINRNNDVFISGILVWSIAAGAVSYASTYYFELARGAIVISGRNDECGTMNDEPKKGSQFIIHHSSFIISSSP
jgi:hypothetical protein